MGPLLEIGEGYERTEHRSAGQLSIVRERAALRTAGCDDSGGVDQSKPHKLKVQLSDAVECHGRRARTNPRVSGNADAAGCDRAER